MLWGIIGISSSIRSIFVDALIWIMYGWVVSLYRWLFCKRDKYWIWYISFSFRIWVVSIGSLLPILPSYVSPYYHYVNNFICFLFFVWQIIKISHTLMSIQRNEVPIYSFLFFVIKNLPQTTYTNQFWRHCQLLTLLKKKTHYSYGE